MTHVLKPGQTFIKWKIEKLLGEGGMGEVYLGRDEWLSRDVAIKVLPVRVNDEPSFVDRMRREAAAGTKVRHPNLVEVIDGGLHEGEIAYVVMEYLEDAKTLRLVVHRAGRIALTDALGFMIQLADGVGALHAANILHRDLKPENVMVLRNGALKIIDFGLARIRTHALRTTVQPPGGGILGTAHYMAPELFFGDHATESTDVYAIGLIGHEMLTGKHVFQHATDEFPSRDEVTARHTLLDAPRVDELVPGVPRALADLLQRALSKDPDERPKARLLARELAAVLRDVQSASSAPDSAVDPGKTRRMSPRAPDVVPAVPPVEKVALETMATERIPELAPALRDPQRQSVDRDAPYVATPGPTTQPSAPRPASAAGPALAIAVGFAIALGGTAAFLWARSGTTSSSTPAASPPIATVTPVPETATPPLASAPPPVAEPANTPAPAPTAVPTASASVTPPPPARVPPAAAPAPASHPPPRAATVGSPPPRPASYPSSAPPSGAPRDPWEREF